MVDISGEKFRGGVFVEIVEGDEEEWKVEGEERVF